MTAEARKSGRLGKAGKTLEDIPARHDAGLSRGNPYCIAQHAYVAGVYHVASCRYLQLIYSIDAVCVQANNIVMLRRDLKAVFIDVAIIDISFTTTEALLRLTVTAYTKLR